MFLEVFTLCAYWIAHRMYPIEENFAKQCEKNFFKISYDNDDNDHNHEKAPED
jgi:hypothetical protein